MKFKSTFNTKLVYVYAIPDKAHENCLKIGEATVDCADIWKLFPNSKELNSAAKERINHQTSTAGIFYKLLYTELLVYNKDGKLRAVNDGEIHKVLERSGIKHKYFNTEAKANEWFQTDLETVKKAITAAKEERMSLTSSEITFTQTPIIFRPEQLDAITKTEKKFKSGGKRMLWYAKMRFGKTLSALQVIKNLNFTKSIIITHRPVVDEGWFNDFDKIFYDRPDFLYGSKLHGESFENLERLAAENNKHYIYFASIQDLRGSETVGGKFDKNNQIFKTGWQCLVIDEAHEGTKTELGAAVINALCKKETHVLHLSGTPFNLLDDFSDSETYTWDYVMEQKAKENWELLHCGDANPYRCLPKMNIFTYSLGELYGQYQEDGAFNFREFFRVEDSGEFKHKDDVKAFLDLLCKPDINSNYPFSTEEYRENFRHTLWMVPGVKEGRALSEMLQQHEVFQHFNIVNVAGDGDQEKAYDDALKAVNDAIGENPEETYSITLSCGRLTTGVSVPSWVAVMMLAGSYSTAAAGYMQTIFRVQTPATINGKVKEECYVFDFSPDRTLKVVAETAKFSVKGGSNNSTDDKVRMGEFLNFCPIIAVEGSEMKPYDVPNLLEQLKRVYIERVITHGFEDIHLYDNEALMQLDSLALEDFVKLKGVIGKTKSSHPTGEIVITDEGFTDEQREKLERAEKKKKEKKELTEEELALLEEKKEKNKQRLNAISILRGISIRMPLLIYGADIEDENDITIDNFTSMIDDLSWSEFMPAGVTKEDFEKFKKYYDKDIFNASGRRIRELVKAADNQPIEERIERIADIFSSFRNPDRETVLTPWKTVNQHLSDCVGGWVFYDSEYKYHSSTPRFVNKGKVTTDVFAQDARVLEINSKSGLYVLYMAYSIYRNHLASEETTRGHALSDEERLKLWDKVVKDNIYIISKTPMAKSIAKRTLLGFRSSETNARYFEDLVNQVKCKLGTFVTKVSNPHNYNKHKDNAQMKFNAIVGNPPYQMNDGSGASTDAAAPIYQSFVTVAKALKPDYISMIMPSKWMVGGRQELNKFREEMKKDEKLSLLFDYEDANVCFSGVHIDGGICYFLWDNEHSGDMLYKFTTYDGTVTTAPKLSNEFSAYIIRDSRILPIIRKVNDGHRFSEIVSKTKPFGIRKDVFNNPDKYKDFNISDTKFSSSLKIFGVKGIKGGARRQTGYISSKAATDKYDAVKKYKLFFTTTYSTNALIPPEPIIADKNEICTETFLLIGPFDNETERNNCNKYIHTNFFRFLLYFGHGTMQVNQNVFNYIPLLEFNDNTQVDWTKDIEEINRNLYEKFSLTPSEIDFIEETMGIIHKKVVEVNNDNE